MTIITGTVVEQYQGDVGKRREELITPALVLDIDAAQRNIDLMARSLADLGRAGIRPHYKTHKSPELARRQVEAGAIGLSTATVWEAAVLADAGLDDIFVVNTVSHPAKIALLASLAASHRILVAVDESSNAAALSAAAVRAGSVLGVMVEVDTGMDRCGVDTPQGALDLARQVTDLPGLRFEGITGYEGHCSLTVQASVISRQSGKVIVDAGNKSIADPANVTMVGHPHTSFRFDEEHGIFAFVATDGSALAVGDSVALVPGYSPTTVNWYDVYHVVRDDVAVDIWPILPRGPGHHGLAPRLFRVEAATT